MSAAAVAAIAARARRRIVEALQAQDALAPDRAAPVPLPRGIDRRVLRRLVREGVVVDDGGGLHHLDVAALAASDRRRGRVRVILLSVVALLAAAVIALIYFN
jgi:inactivated superfamily I helicase